MSPLLSYLVTTSKVVTKYGKWSKNIRNEPLLSLFLVLYLVTTSKVVTK